MGPTDTRPLTLEEAIILTRETAANLGGSRASKALEMCAKIAERHCRPSGVMRAVEHFRAAGKELEDPDKKT